MSKKLITQTTLLIAIVLFGFCGVDSAPEGGGLAGKATSMLGSSSGSAKGTAALTDSFSSLGLSPDMVGKYTDIILDYVQSEGGQQAMTLLKNALL